MQTDSILTQDAFHALRPEDLRGGVSFPVGVAAWIRPKLYSLLYWRNRMQIWTQGYFDICTSGVCLASTLAYTRGATGVTRA